jgi:hypothetical protein
MSHSNSLKEYPPITQVVPPLPSKYGDSTDESEPGIDYLKYLRPEYKTPDDHYQANLYAVHNNTTEKRPFAGQGKPLREAIKDAWATWKDMLFHDAESGDTEAQIDLSMAYWRGDVNYGIEQNKSAALEWMEIAATKGRHEINPKGGCGFEACFRCYAENLYRRMKIWLENEIRQKDMSVAQIVALNTPHLVFNILSFCDVDTLKNLFQVNNLWHEIVSDSRAWSHINMLEEYPIPTIPIDLLPEDSPKKNEQNDAQNVAEVDSSNKPAEVDINPKPDCKMITLRDSKRDIELFTQLPPLHRNICRVCNEKITPPEQHSKTLVFSPQNDANEQSNPENQNSPSLIQFYKLPEPYMIEASTIPDPFWKNFACHRDCFYQRAQGTITPYTLQGVKTVTFQGLLKQEAIHQIQWEKFAFRRLQVPNMIGLTFNTLLPPQKPDSYDDDKIWCENYRTNNPDLQQFLAENRNFEDIDEDYGDLDDIDCGDCGDDIDCDDEDVEVYGELNNKPIKDQNDIKNEENHQEENEDEDEDDNNSLFNIDDFLSGDSFQILGDDDHLEDADWKEQVRQNKREIMLYWSKCDLIEWYDKSLSQYQYISNVIMAYSSGLMWSEHPNQQFYPNNVQNSSSIPPSTINCTQPIDISRKVPMQYDYFTFPRAYPPQTRQKNGQNPHSKKDNDEAALRLTIDPADLPVIIPGYVDNSNTHNTQSDECNENDKSGKKTTLSPVPAENPYNTPGLFDTLLQAQYHNDRFIIDNSPLWLLLTQFTQYRKYAKLFHEYDDVVVQYPTPQAHLFPHGDSRYANVNYSQYLYGKQGQFEQQYIQSDNHAQKLFRIDLESYISPDKPALPLVYEIFQLLLRSTTGFTYLKFRDLLFRQLLPRFDLKWNPITKQIQHYPNGSKIVELESGHYRAKGD